MGGALQSGNELGLANDLGCPGKRVLEITHFKPNVWETIVAIKTRKTEKEKLVWGGEKDKLTF